VSVKKGLKLYLLLAAVISVSAFLGGCQVLKRSSESTQITISERQMVGVYELANQLSLSIEEINSSYIKLSNSSNLVLVFTHTGGRFFVNGEPVGEVGDIERVNTSVFFEESLVSRIRSAMGKSKPLYTPSRLIGTVVIDPGHGGKDPGAIAVNGHYEKAVNLSVALKVAYLLRQKGMTVILTRDSDRFVELEERAAIANRRNADLFVSIHADSHSDRGVRGFTVYIARSASTSSSQAANKMVRALKGTGLSNKGIQRADFRVLVKTRCPAILVEMGYLSNAQEASLLVTNYFQEKMARAIAEGIAGNMR